MLHLDLFAAEMLMESTVTERLQEAEMHRLLRQARTGQRGWLLRLWGWCISGFGRLLVSLGRRLQTYGLARPMSMEPGEAFGHD